MCVGNSQRLFSIRKLGSNGGIRSTFLKSIIYFYSHFRIKFVKTKNNIISKFLFLGQQLLLIFLTGQYTIYLSIFLSLMQTGLRNISRNFKAQLLSTKVIHYYLNFIFFSFTRFFKTYKYFCKENNNSKKEYIYSFYIFPYLFYYCEIRFNLKIFVISFQAKYSNTLFQLNSTVLFFLSEYDNDYI